MLAAHRRPQRPPLRRRRSHPQTREHEPPTPNRRAQHDCTRSRHRDTPQAHSAHRGRTPWTGSIQMRSAHSAPRTGHTQISRGRCNRRAARRAERHLAKDFEAYSLLPLPEPDRVLGRRDIAPAFRRRRASRQETQPNCGVWACFLVSRGLETACNSSGCCGTPFAGEAVFVVPTFPQDLASCLRAWRGRSVDTESPCRPRLVNSPTLGAPYGLPRPLRVCYGLSAAIGGTGSRRGIRRATRVQLGIHQLASPSSRIRAGTSSARMTVASRMIPAARPIASGLTS